MKLLFFQYVLLQAVNTQVSSVPDNGWAYDVSKDFALPMLLAVVAVWGAYKIFVLESRRDKQKEQNQNEVERLDKLTYFSILVNDAFDVSVQQNENILRLAEKIQVDSIYFHPMNQVPLNVLKRITEVLNLEVYLLAYTEQFSAIRKRAAEEFQEIVSSIDFLYELFKLMIVEHERSVGFNDGRTANYQKLFYDAFTLVGKLYLSLQVSDKASMTQLEITLMPFHQNAVGNNYDLEFYYHSFFVPVNTFCTSYFLNRQNPIADVVQLANWTRDGIQSFSEIQSQNLFFRDGLLIQFKSVKRTLFELLEAKRRLTKEFQSTSA